MLLVFASPVSPLFEFVDWSSFFFILIRLLDLDEDDDDDDEEDEDEEDEDDEFDDCDDDDDEEDDWDEVNWLLADVAVLVVPASKLSLLLLFDVDECFLFSFTAIALLWAAFLIRELLRTNKSKNFN